MEQIDTYPGGLDKPHEQIEEERYHTEKYDMGGGMWWMKFKLKRGSLQTVYIWFNEGYGLRMHQQEWDAIKELARLDDD